jgi:hypothetical protein
MFALPALIHFLPCGDELSTVSCLMQKNPKKREKVPRIIEKSTAR